MKIYEGNGVLTSQFLISALDRREWSASRLSRVIPGGNSARYPLCRRLGGHKSWSGRFGEEKKLSPQESNRGLPAGILSLH
jgi:hypothetical protein